MYVGEGQDQLHALANKLEERAVGFDGMRQKREYYRGLRAGLQMAARAARKEATRLLRAQRKAAAQNNIDETEDD